MNRSGYFDDGWDSQESQWAHIRWRGAVNSAIKGARGQDFLRRLAEYMDAMPVKELISDDLEANGSYCALGVACAAENIDMENIQKLLGEYDSEWGYEGGDEDSYWDALSHELNIAGALAREIMFVNDDYYDYRGYRQMIGPMQKPERRRWLAVRGWIERHLI